MTISIRAFRESDTEAAVSLWQECGLTRPWNDPRADIARKLAVQSGLFLVAEDAAARGSEHADEFGTALVGTVMAGYDGHRGWMYYLASAPERRGQGIGKALVAEAERRLEALGCPKAMLIVRRENDAVVGFYDSLGYDENDVLLLGKRLIED